MFILYDILGKLKNEFVNSRKGDERGIWFVYTIIAIIIPFGFTGIRKKTILYVHGFAQDSLGSVVENFMENDSLSGNRWQAVVGT